MNSEKSTFHFKKFALRQEHAAMKTGTDAVLLGAWCSVTSAQKVLDIGAGTGIIGLMIAQRNISCHIFSLEPDESALTDLEFNVNASGFQHRMTVIQKTLQGYSGHSFDLIISNPPFFHPDPGIAQTNRKTARQTVTLPHDDLLKLSSEKLQHHGCLSLILPYDEGGKVLDMAGSFGLFLSRQCLVFPDKDSAPRRRLMEFRKHTGPITSEKLRIRNGSLFSEDYINLTKEFYLDSAFHSERMQ